MNLETSLRPAIRKLIHSSQVKPEAVGVILAGLENENVTAEDWQTLFNKEGAEIAIKQKIYSPQLVRLITLRAIVIPETLPEFLAWLNIQGGKKPDEHQTISLEFQKDIGLLFPQEQLTKGINYLLVNLLSKQISVDCVYWLLTTDGSAWVYAQKEFITDVKYDLQLICDYFARQLDQKFFNRLKSRKQVWASLISNWQGIQKGNHKSEEYQPLAELLARLKEYELAAYFYQVSQGNVANNLFYKMAYEKYLQIHPHPTNVPYQKYRNSHITVYGLQIKRKPTLVEFIDHVLYFITLEVDMKIQFVIPLSLLILVSGWFIGAKSWESSTSATDIEKSLCSKTFPDDKNCPVIVLDPKTSYGFSEIKQLVPAVVEDVVSEKTKQNPEPVEKTKEDIRTKVIEKLKSLIGSTGLKYEDLNPGKEPTDLAIQKQWMTAIYNYQITNKVEYQKIADKGSEDNQCNLLFGICLWPLGQNNDTSDGVNEKDSELYKKLKNDILYYMKSQQPQTTTTNNNQKEVNKNELKDKQKAIDDYTQAIKINPNYAPAYNNRGVVRYELGNKQGAIDDYNQAIKINPNLVQAYYNRGIARDELGNKPGAIDDYNQAIKIDPNDADAYYNRGVVRDELGNKQGAIDDYNLAIKINPNYAPAYNNRGVVRYELGNKQGAIDDYNQAIKINPNLVQAYYGRGNVRNDLGDKPGAIDDFQQAAKLYQQQGKNQDYQNALNRIKELQQ